MKYSMTLNNDSNEEKVKLSFVDFTDLVEKAISQKNIWLLEINKDYHLFSSFEGHKVFVSDIVEVWNNGLEKNRNQIKTFLNDFDNTVITKYWDIKFENIITSKTQEYKYENLEFPERPPISTKLLIVPPQPEIDIYLSEAKNKCNIFDMLLSSRKTEILNKAQLEHQKDYNDWRLKKEEIEKANEKTRLENEKCFSDFLKRKSKYENEQEVAKQNYQKGQDEINKIILNKQAKLDTNDIKEVIEYIKELLRRIDFPITFKVEIEIEYVQETKSLVINYLLPNVEDMYLVKEIKPKYSHNKIIEKPLTKKEVDELYDYLVYSICLQSVRYIFKSEAGSIIQSLVYNGWIESIDKATGNDYKACIISVHTTNEAINNINFSRVNPIECFKSLRGLSGAKLTNLSPVAPILDIDKKDKRFVATQDVLKEVDTSTNLAAMGWEDFEHLIREIFEKEFSQNGGEVKITQASRDGGVDAIAFDPDPIRGGKIVIQAKRYTNAVGVSAVRDLFGTLMNEGATKGILVTTSNYGSDAYEFAKGKPITLLTGANLLSLLGKHGVKARIDIREAKIILKAQDNE